MPPSITITILAFKSRSTIGRCVTNATRLQYEGLLEVLVNEQGQDDDEYQILQELAHTLSAPNRAIKITRSENVGFAAGHNRLIRQNKSDFILCLNADAVLLPDFLEKGMLAFDDARVGAVQGKLLRWDPVAENVVYGPSGKNIIDSVGLTPLRNRRIINRGQGEEDGGQYEIQEEVFGADGAAPLYRRAALEDIAIPQVKKEKRKEQNTDVEYFDEDFFMYKEDVDLAWRMQWRGWKTIYVPKAIAWHARGSGESAARNPLKVFAERRKLSRSSKYYSFVNQRLMQFKNESISAIARDFFPLAFRELGTWLVIVFTEPYTFRAIGRICSLLPKTLRKRRIIFSRRSVGANPYRWFQ